MEAEVKPAEVEEVKVDEEPKKKTRRPNRGSSKTTKTSRKSKKQRKQLKNKFFKSIKYAILVVLLCTANFAFAVNSVEASNIPAMKTIAVKFVLAMLGVAFFLNFNICRFVFI